MKKPLLLRIEAQKEASVDKALDSTKQGADELSASFDKAADRSDQMGMAIKAAAGGEAGKNLKKASASAKELTGSLKGVSDQATTAGTSLDKALDNQIANKLIAIESVTQGLTGAFRSAAQAIVGFSSAAIEAASEFEILEAKLATVQGSTERARETFKFAQDFAAKTPFDVQGIVNATVQIEVYGQRSREILPLVAKLAAGMGKDINDTALVVGKALSGSLEGFESLRNEYGITTRELVKFGAVQNKAGGILVQTAADAAKAEKALKQIIGIRFGDAIERQSKTLRGQLSNTRDEVKNFVSEVGKGGAEVLKFGTAFVGGGFAALRKLPGPLKEVAGASLTISAGITAVGAAGAGAALGLLNLNTQLTTAAAVIPALGPAATATGTALGIMGTASTAVGTAVRFMLGPVGLAITAVGAVAFAFDRAADASEALQAQMKEESYLFQKRIQENRELAKALDALAAAEGRTRTGAPQAQASGKSKQELELERVKQILDQSSASDFFKKMKEAGFDAETVKKLTGDTADQIEVQKSKVDELNKKLKESEDFDYAQSAKSGVDLGDSIITKSIRKDLKASEQQLAIEQERADKLKLVGVQYERNTKQIDALGNAAQRTNDFLKYADKIGDLRSMNAAFGVLQQNISVAAQELKKLNEPTDRNSLLEKLRQGAFDKNDPLKEKVESYLDLLQERDKREKELRKKNLEDEKKALQDLQNNLTAAKAARDVSRQEELANLAEQYEIAKQLGKEGEEELTRIQNRQATLRKEARKEEAQSAKQAAKDALDAARSLPSSARASERGTQAAVDAYDTAISRVKAWVAGNQKLIEQFPELGRQGETAIKQLELQRAQAEVARTTKNFSDLQGTLRDLEADAVNTAEKLDAVSRARDLVRSARASGKITDEQASEQTSDLDRKERALRRTKEQEDLRYQQQKLEISRQSAEQELAIAETLADGSIRSNDKLLVARERLYQYRIKAIQLEKDAAIAAGEEKVRAEETAAAKIKQIEQQKTADLHAELKKRYDAEQGRLQGIIDENQTEDALDFGTLDFGGDSEADKKRRTRKAAERELEDLERRERFRKANPQIVAQTAEDERQKALRAADPSGVLRDGQAALSPQVETPGTTINNTTNTVIVNTESRKTRNVASAEDAVKEVEKAITTAQYYDPKAGIG